LHLITLNETHSQFHIHTHTNTHTVELVWKCGRVVAMSSNLLTTDKYPCPQRDSKLQSLELYYKLIFVPKHFILNKLRIYVKGPSPPSRDQKPRSESVTLFQIPKFRSISLYLITLNINLNSLHRGNIPSLAD